MTVADPVAVAVHIAAILEGLSVRYVLGGSLASTAFGEPRATLDVDLAADLDEGRVDAFVRMVEQGFFVDATWVRQEVRRRGSFRLVHRASMIRVDVFVPEWIGLHLWKWERRRRVDLGAREGAVDVSSPEAIVIQKLVRYRDGGAVSDRQWRDVIGVLRTQRGHLDVAGMRAQARSSGVDDLLDRACASAEAPPR